MQKTTVNSLNDFTFVGENMQRGLGGRSPKI